jgi:hypothetical protein
MSTYQVEIRTGILTGSYTLHTWLHITKPDGSAEAWGLYPAERTLTNLAYGPGDLRQERLSASDKYTGTSGPLSITPDQYSNLMANIAAMDANPPDYSLISLPGGIQCSMWAVTTLQQIGVVPLVLSPELTPEFIPFLDSLIWNPLLQNIGLDPQGFAEVLAGITGWKDFITSADWSNPYATPAISNILGTTPDPLVKTLRWVPKDPLVLDLDGDGLEITPLKAGVMFDADGDTVRNASAWIGADDGLLARDLNGNGIIDSGLELFGDNTLLANGKTAAHGFAALADLDLGSVVNGANGVMVGARDGVIDARDACFAELRVWRDLNQDGVSQADELATLTDADIAAIGLSNTATSKNYNGDATQTRSGSFTRADGSEGEAGNFLLAVNYFERAFAPVVVSETARALPDFKGSGWVRDLREAATLEPGLIDLVAQADHAPTRAGYKAAIGDLIKSWALASSYASAGRQGMAQGYGLILSEPVDAQERGWMDVAIKADAATRAAFRAGLDEIDGAKFDAMHLIGDRPRFFTSATTVV